MHQADGRSHNLHTPSCSNVTSIAVCRTVWRTVADTAAVVVLMRPLCNVTQQQHLQTLLSLYVCDSRQSAVSFVVAIPES